MFVVRFRSDDSDSMAAHRTIYEFTVKDADGKDVSLSKYKGQVVIIVNVASKCGYTSGHYKELKAVQDKYYEQGLRVAAFPCNQFGGQVSLLRSGTVAVMKCIYCSVSLERLTFYKPRHG
ncbi:unnamed protein product [Angiostrongylus costaricensis]|uniref:Glutathione peroxidase n=1 Tax=Angiostrongylus costaricensis TaxID=334426 RepID=A0A0R3P9T3_ANGCS|nr:unnamed protein product [Angiostrongylus costaricensis]